MLRVSSSLLSKTGDPREQVAVLSPELQPQSPSSELRENMGLLADKYLWASLPCTWLGA